jgi:hypothetical protein
MKFQNFLHSVLSSSGVGSSSVQPPASTTFGFPLSPAPELFSSAAPALAPSLAPGFKFTPLRPLEIPEPCFDPPSLTGAAALGEKLSSSLPTVASKPILSYFKRAKALRVKNSVKWTDKLFSGSMEAAKLSCTVKNFKATVPPAKNVVEPPAKKRTETLVKPGLFSKGFLNLPPIVSAPPASPREVNKVEEVGPSSPPSGCFDSFSQPRNDIVVWEEDDDYWDGLPLDWAMEGDFGEKAMAIRDAMEEDYQRIKMIARQKS